MTRVRGGGSTPRQRGAGRSLRAVAGGGDAQGVAPVLRRAVDRMTKALMYMDDSSGIVGDELRVMMALYAQACTAACPDANSLAGWLVTLAYHGPGWPEIRLREFAAALGERGLAEIAALVEQRAAVVGPDSWGRLFATRTLREQLAAVSGEVDGYVGVLAENLNSAAQYLRIVNVLRDAVRPAEAIHPGYANTSLQRSGPTGLMSPTGSWPKALRWARSANSTRPSTRRPRAAGSAARAASLGCAAIRRTAAWLAETPDPAGSTTIMVSRVATWCSGGSRLRSSCWIR